MWSECCKNGDMGNRGQRHLLDLTDPWGQVPQAVRAVVSFATDSTMSYDIKVNLLSQCGDK